jgi:asparagine synthase (glutamine-hydrolysing)
MHRGPDGQGHYIDDYCELVHRRLAIVDVTSAGNQPMPNEDGSVQVVFNGEIYNHLTLRAEMKSQGHRFRSNSDTEVLVHLYEEYGADLVNRLRGMYAFAIYDRDRRRLLIARDRFGIKPLYYAVVKGQCVFASEIKAILAVADFLPTIDRQACYDYLGLGYIPEPFTGFTSIHMLPKATTMLVSAEGQHQKKFYELHARAKSRQNLSVAVDSVSESLTQAVRSQREADVPVAALLSGGIDSSLVVAAYCRTTNASPITFNVRFPDEEYDETGVAQSVANHYRTHHRTIDLGDWAVTPESVIALLEHFDQPFADTSLIPTYWVARAIREQGIKCALSGDGGDEAFGGYGRFWRANTLMRLMELPGWAQKGLIVAGSNLAQWTRDWGRQVSKAVKLAQAGQKDSAVLLAGLSNYLNEQQKQDLVSVSARQSLQSVYRHFNGHKESGTYDLDSLSQRMTENLFAVGLPSDMLRKVDMMSMLASLEVRVPFLDEEIVELGLDLSHDLKTDGHQGKLVLRSLAARWLPQRVAAHPKHGFSIPLDVLVSDRFHSMLQDYLLSPASKIRDLINLQLVQRWLEMFQRSKLNHHVGSVSRGGLYQRIFILLALELWLRRHKLSW